MKKSNNLALVASLALFMDCSGTIALKIRFMLKKFTAKNIFASKFDSIRQINRKNNRFAL